jgi:Ser/Thr protein kinase RdoA (MazF antagonist)
MRQAAHLPFVPSVSASPDGETIISEGGRLWDLTQWMSGSPRETPTLAELEAACAAAAQLHAVWRTSQTLQPCPGVRNRLRLLREWISSPTPVVSDHKFAPQLNALVRHAIVLIGRAVPIAIRSLERWENMPLVVQPCLRDLRGEHVLFDERGVAGIVDYGAMAEDHPAVDLARLLGDFAAGDDRHFSVGLQSYRAAGGELDIPDDFVQQLAQSGALGSAIIWLRRLKSAAQAHPLEARIEARFARLVRRIERFTPV